MFRLNEIGTSYKKYIYNFLKIAISLILIVIILFKLDSKIIFEEMISINFLVILLILLSINIFNIFVSALKLRIILEDITEIKKTSFWSISKIYFYSTFLGMFLPTNFGGDGAKYYFLRNKLKDAGKFKIAYSIFIERLSGIVMLLLIMVFSLFIPSVRNYYYSIYKIVANYFVINEYVLILMIIIIFIVIMGLLYLFFSKRYLFYKSLEQLNRLSYIKIIILSISFQILMIFNNYIAFYLITGYSNILLFIILIPITILLMTLPISIQGIGLRDGLALLIIPLFLDSVMPEKIIVYTLTMNLLIILSSVIGGLLYSYNKIKESKV